MYVHFPPFSDPFCDLLGVKGIGGKPLCFFCLPPAPKFSKTPTSNKFQHQNNAQTGLLFAWSQISCIHGRPQGTARDDAEGREIFPDPENSLAFLGVGGGPTPLELQLMVDKIRSHRQSQSHQIFRKQRLGCTVARARRDAPKRQNLGDRGPYRY